MNRFEGITDASLREQIEACRERVKRSLWLSSPGWQPIEVDAQFAAELDAELRRRHNERTFPARKRTA